jgi:hypothetical protein
MDRTLSATSLLDLYKKLTTPEANATFKNKWFEGITTNFFQMENRLEIHCRYKGVN